MDDLLEAGKIAFATEYAYVLKAQFCHWNVEGPDFVQFHELFGKIYEEAYSSIDDFAEKLRSMGAYTPASFQRLSMLSEIDGQMEVISKDEMVLMLLADNDVILKALKFTYDLAEQNNEHGFSNFLAERMDAHRKHGWMLRASSK
jgi:starvation-inducible DNA-binding protein